MRSGLNFTEDVYLLQLESLMTGPCMIQLTCPKIDEDGKEEGG